MTVSVGDFEGPFDLLLHLILADQIDLYRVTISTIVDAYLAEMARMEQCDLEVATEFLLIAATLVELKCRRLLPHERDPDLDEDLAIWEERDLLLARLLECKTFKDAAHVLEERAARAALVHPRVAGPDERFADLAPDLLADVTPDKLRRAFLRAVAPKPVPTVDLGHVHHVRASVSATISELCDELPRLGPVSFRRLTVGCGQRLEIVVHFLAVLELFKQGFVELDQVDHFGDIIVTWTAPAADAELAVAGADRYEG